MAICYADANATTAMPEEVQTAWLKAVNRGDPIHASSAVADSTGKLVDRFQKQIEEESGLGAGEFHFIHTSGEAEANVLAISSCVDAYWASTGRMPHIVLGASESDSIRNYAQKLFDLQRCKYDYAIVDAAVGAPTAATVKAAIRDNTCLVTVAGANPLTGALTNLPKISAVCITPPSRFSPGQRRVPLHSDLSALFARSLVYPNGLRIDSYSAGFHLMHGPPGFGVLAVRTTLVKGYGLQAMISGRMLNVPALAASIVAYRYTLEDRSAKNATLASCVNGIERVLRACVKVYDYPGDPPADLRSRAAATREGKAQTEADRIPLDPLDEPLPPHVIFFTMPPIEKRLPNTLLFAARSANRPAAKIQEVLEEDHRVLIGRVSHHTRQLQSLRVPQCLYRYALRISLPDDATKKTAQALVQALVQVINNPPQAE